jgi:hypothetical protein
VIGRFDNTLPIGETRSFLDTAYSVGNGAFPPVELFEPAQVALSGIAVGPSAVTSRRIYRSPANGAGLQLLTTLADNATTTYRDALADATLGAAPPSADTSGLQMAAGQVPVGAASMPVSSAAWARAGGGWAAVGNGRQVIRYSGISGNQITGIPASGPGSIVAPVNYNSTLTAVALLTAVAGLAAGVRAGAPVAIWVQRDDAAAQSALGARVGGDGVIEHLITDDRRAEPSMVALCDADLAMYSAPLITVRYTGFDRKSRSGKPIRIVLPAHGLDVTLTIQEVTIDTSGARAQFAVVASSVRVTLEDLLRRMVGTLEEGF